jgi:ABC-2 type transport system ATP-binding protein
LYSFYKICVSSETIESLDIPVLEIKNLSKSYGSLKALDSFSLTINKGEICGILGPNGSGKTTTLGILLDILKADSGDFLWFGKRVDDSQRQRIGALLESPIFYPHLSAIDNLKIIADIKNIGYNQVEEVIDTVGLTTRKKSKYKTYSLGMKQRLAIASTLLGNPEVMILDEPTNGLDPQGIAEIRNLILNIGKTGTTILLASHMLDEVQKICSHVVILQKGKKKGDGRVSEVLSSSSAFELASDNMDELKTALVANGSFSSINLEEDMLIAVVEKEIKAAELNKYLTTKGIYLTHLAMRKKSLEKYFLDLLAEKHA